MRKWRATARHVELLDDIRALADFPVVEPKREKTDVRGQKSEDRNQNH